MPDQVTAEAEPEAVEAEPGENGERPAGGPGRLWWTCVVLLLVVVLGFIGLGTYSWLRQHEAATTAQRDQAILAAARGELDLMANLRHATARDSIARLQAGATGPFRQQFAGADSAFFALLDQGQVDSTGQVTEAAVQQADATSAQVLVAVSATVRNTDYPNGQARDYRSVVSLNFENGHWLVSDARVVP
ncbi:MAG TPA: hypothetical protein VHC18_28060 [Amycolatopsis sp.]|nr:hypothetical protein [Amycolatopsis sp.]